MTDLWMEAEREYDEWTAARTRTEKRRIWNGRSYVVREVVVHDLGRKTDVEPSSAPFVREIARNWGKLKRKTAIQRILDYIEDNGPARMTDLSRELGIPRGTVQRALSYHACVGMKDDGLWHIMDGQPPPPRRKYARERIYDLLAERGDMTASDISRESGINMPTVRAALYHKKMPFERVGKTGDGVLIWGVRE